MNKTGKNDDAASPSLIPVHGSQALSRIFLAPRFEG